MLHQNSVFHGLLKHVPWHKFEQSVEKYRADDGCRATDDETAFDRFAVRSIERCGEPARDRAGMESHETRLYHLGGAAVKRSTLSDANPDRPWQVFGELVHGSCWRRAHRGLRRAVKDAVRLIDSTSVRLSSLSADWATFSTDVFGAKAHIIYDPHGGSSGLLCGDAGQRQRHHGGQSHADRAGATYVYDLGYYDYRWWAELR